MKRTNRGFSIYSKFMDSNRSLIRIQQSSRVGGPFVWIFCQDRMGNDVVPCVGAPGGVSSVSPHLTRAQARRIAKALLKFANGDEQ